MKRSIDNWHDLIEATIDAIHVAPIRKELRIDVTCAFEGGKQRQIIAQEVHDFIVTDMRLSNIIDRVTLLGTNEGDEAETAKNL